MGMMWYLTILWTIVVVSCLLGIRAILTTRFDSKNFNYYKLRYLYGRERIKKYFSGNAAIIPVENFKTYAQFAWLLNSYSKWSCLGNYLQYNKFYIDSRDHLVYLLKWLEEENVEYKDTHIIDSLSRNRHISRDGILYLREILDWSEGNLYKNFPAELIVQDWGSHPEKFLEIIDWKLASKHFVFLNKSVLKEFKDKLDVRLLKKNPCVNQEDLESVFGDIDGTSDKTKVDSIDNLPPNSVKITDEIYRVGDELYIKTISGYVKDIST